MSGIANSEGVTEAFKASDQMKWVRYMNNNPSLCRRNILYELIFWHSSLEHDISQVNRLFFGKIETI